MRKKRDIAGQRFGRMVAIKNIPSKWGYGTAWLCLCDCGEEIAVLLSQLIAGNTRSCGCLLQDYYDGKMPRRKREPSTIINPCVYDRIGFKSGRLTLVDFIKSPGMPLKAILNCDCGGQKIMGYRGFKKGSALSCGCIAKERSANAINKKREVELEIEKKKAATPEWKPYINLTGKRKGKLQILHLCGAHITKSGAKTSLWYCLCDCGKHVVLEHGQLKRSKGSCGCDLPPKPKRIITKKQRKKLSEAWRKKYLVDNIGDWKNRKQTDSKNRRRKATITNHVRDKYHHQCYACKQEHTKEEPLHAHHWKGYRQYPRLRWLVVNHVLLCRQCHEGLHKRFDYKEAGSIKEQLRVLCTNKGL